MNEPVVVERGVAGLRAHVRDWRAAGETVGLVPTMGALHDGHMALVRAARAACDRVAVSIFVNPAQFAPNEDLDAYPRREAADLATLEEAGVDLAFVPTVAEMYPDGFATTVAVPELSGCLCGAGRPTHFQGVATVVTKLLLQCLPDGAWFGEKDFQQLQVIRRLTRDLDIPVDIHGVETVREADGLALSSRNAYLTPDQRQNAPILAGALRLIANKTAAGTAIPDALSEARRMLDGAGFGKIDYLEIRDAGTLAPVEDWTSGDRPARVFGAAWLGDTRLIDNIAVI